MLPVGETDRGGLGLRGSFIHMAVLCFLIYGRVCFEYVPSEVVNQFYENAFG